MLFDQNIKTPSHEKIVLSQARVSVDIDAGRVQVYGQFDDGAVTSDVIEFDENDAIRLAAFLNRWFRERNQGIVRAEAERVKASREAKKARYEARRPTGDRYAGPGLEGI